MFQVVNTVAAISVITVMKFYDICEYVGHKSDTRKKIRSYSASNETVRTNEQTKMFLRLV